MRDQYTPAPASPQPHVRVTWIPLAAIPYHPLAFRRWFDPQWWAALEVEFAVRAQLYGVIERTPAMLNTPANNRKQQGGAQ